MRSHLTVIQRVTGHRPDTCPWRAWYHPLVHEVMRVTAFSERGNLAAVIDDDTPQILIDAVACFEAAVAATLADDRAIERKQREAERAAREAREGRSR